MSVEDRGLLFLSGGGDSTGAVATRASTGEKWLLGLMGTAGTALLVGAIWASEKNKKKQYQPTREQYRPELAPSQEAVVDPARVAALVRAVRAHALKPL